MTTPPDHKVSSLRPFTTAPRAAFSLVEIIIAVGIFAFCVVGIVYLIGNALSSSRDSELDSSLSSALHNVDTQLRALPSTGTNAVTTSPISFYFDFSGNSVASATASNVFYRATVTRLTGASLSSTLGVTGTSHYFVWSVAFSYPAPSYSITSSNHPLVGRALYDSTP